MTWQPDWDNIKVHPVADFFPMIEGDEWVDFLSLIRDHGQRTPILFWREMLIDGRNRLAACRSLGLMPPKYHILSDSADPIAIIEDNNLGHRELPPAYKLQIKIKIAKYVEADRPAGRPKTSSARSEKGNSETAREITAPGAVISDSKENKDNLSKSKTRREKIAEATGVSERTVQHGLIVDENGSDLMHGRLLKER